MIPAIVIGGVSSGVGKTLISVGIMAALKKRGLNVQPFKVGPDYIDPGYHTAVTLNASVNLDGWMMEKNEVISSFERNCLHKDIAVIEGVMGLFDGINGKSDEGSTAQIAKWLQLPVILIVDAKGLARSASAIIKGFEQFDDTKIVGVIFNRVGSARHREYLKDAVNENSKVEILGYLPKDERLTVKSRHLGLHLANEVFSDDLFLPTLVNMIEENINIDRLIELAKNNNPEEKIPPALPEATPFLLQKKRVAVAMDQAFSFYYTDNLYYLKKSGAELIFFSPLKDQALPKNIDVIYFGGGYPELFAQELESNTKMRKEIFSFSGDGGKIYGECGGLIYLSSSIELNGKSFSMTEVFPFQIEMSNRLCALGYVEIVTTEDTPLMGKGERVRGHQFRYSKIKEGSFGSVKKIYTAVKNSDNSSFTEGYLFKNTLASYIHLHFGSKRTP